ncbi:MAG: hypothetical protein ACRD3G_16905 [Vicinamibacterales bacterium]
MLTLTWCASNLLGQLNDRQWREAFQAGGYEPPAADRFIRKLRTRCCKGGTSRVKPRRG